MQRPFYFSLFSIRAIRRMAAMLAAAIIVLLPAGVAAQGYETMAKQAILVDAASGAVLFEKNADRKISPSVMSKVMVADMVFHALARQEIAPETEFMVPDRAWRRRSDISSGMTMFTEQKAWVRVADLLRGLVIVSANDASLTLAEGLAGSEAAFVARMNDHARALGLTQTVFANVTKAEASQQATSVRDLSRLALHVMAEHPQQYSLFREPNFIWNRIRQLNRDQLLAMNANVDGMKSWQSRENDHGLIVSSIRAGQRLVVIVNGLESARHAAKEAFRLLEWGYASFEEQVVFARDEEISRLAVHGGAPGSVGVAAKVPVTILSARDTSERIGARIVYTGPLRAPLAKGAEVGRVQILRNDVLMREVPVHTLEAVAVGSLMERAADGLVELTGRAARSMSDGR